MFRSSLKSEIEAYLELRSQFYSVHTIRCINLALFKLDRYLTDNGFHEKVLTEDILIHFISTITGSSKTIKNYIIFIRGFIKYLNALGNESFLPEPIKAKSDYIPYIYSDEEINRIFWHADNLRESLRHKHNYQLIVPMALRIIYGCGTRLEETMSLCRKDIDFKNCTIFLKNTKFHKERLIPIHETLLSILERYCLAIGIMHKPNAYLFPGRSEGTHLCSRQMNTWFSEILKLANIDQRSKKKGERGACIHNFRHLFVMKAIRQLEEHGHSVSLDELLLPTYLGHECLIDTDKYMKFSGVQISNSLDAFEAFSNGIIPDVEVPNDEE